VIAADIDAFAAAAIGLNAKANGVSIEARLDDLLGLDQGWEVILAGDICYERELAAQVIDWLSSLSQRGATVLIGDPGRSYLPKDRLAEVATYQVPVTRALEDAEIKKSSVWRLAGEGALEGGGFRSGGPARRFLRGNAVLDDAPEHIPQFGRILMPVNLDGMLDGRFQQFALGIGADCDRAVSFRSGIHGSR
jgi:hypothetical protein